MSKIIRYKPNNNDSYDVVVTGVEIPEQAIELLDVNQPIDVDCSVIDPNSITGKQRRKIFALCNDIESHTGQPRDYMRYLFMDYVEVLYGYEKRLSLSDCTRTQANQIIEVTLDWIFHNNIPLAYKTSELLKQDKSFLYWSTVNRNCIICGKPYSDLAHHYAIGRGKNRKTMNHYGYEVLALCREHHSEQHNIGVDTFDKKYHLENSWIKVDEKLNSMLKGVKQND
ncbi:putative HNHc nuclease [Staphylococcus simulans]|uniref:putative HNHc nuclease n=1 Tax=Staphylococcus simulans TaxID=1286 RepID=UPI0021CF7023|nr:putative HNHc nuclease [Staphylococcus simulans]UXV43421.1 putative HNHc nuclease [Staphylococcus simulans]